MCDISKDEQIIHRKIVFYYLTVYSLSSIFNLLKRDEEYFNLRKYVLFYCCINFIRGKLAIYICIKMQRVQNISLFFMRQFKKEPKESYLSLGDIICYLFYKINFVSPTMCLYIFF